MPDMFLILLGLATIGVTGWAIVQRLRDDGANQLRDEIEAARVKAIHDKKEKDDEVSNLAPADLDKRFDRWMR